MNKLIILNGVINSGKSTIGRELQNKCKNLAFVEIDDLRNFIPWMPIEDAVPLNIKNGIDVSRNFIKNNIDVIIAYPLSDNDFNYMKDLIDFDCEIIGVTLYCELSENLKNRGTRELSHYEKERLEWMHRNGLAKPLFSKIYNNTRKTIEETCNELIIDLKLTKNV